MGVFQIILLVLGVAIFVVSFFLPGGKNDKIDQKNAEKKIRELVDEEIKKRISEATIEIDDVVTDKKENAVATAERGLERVASEKMMMVNEYADSVLADISKNHDEVVFLYSMLNDKQEELKGVISEVEKANKDAKKRIEDIDKRNRDGYELSAFGSDFKVAEQLNNDNEKRIALENSLEGNKQPDEENAGISDSEPIQYEEISEYPETEESSTNDVNVETQQNEKSDIDAELDNMDLSDVQELMYNLFEKDSERKSVLEQDLNSERKPKKAEKKTRKKKQVAIPDVSAVSGGNNNEKILKLYEEGKSNVAIAKELGLGVGEVKLVIDLFKQG